MAATLTALVALLVTSATCGPVNKSVGEKQKFYQEALIEEKLRFYHEALKELEEIKEELQGFIIDDEGEEDDDDDLLVEGDKNMEKELPVIQLDTNSVEVFLSLLDRI